MTETKNDLFEYMQPSEVANDYLKHVNALKPAEKMPVDSAFSLSKEALKKPLLLDLIDANVNVRKKAVVLIEHDEVFEIRRLPDKCNTKLFYRYLKGDDKKDSKQDSIDTIEKVCSDYLKLDISKVLKYDSNITPELKDSGVISHVYIQRRVSSMAVFRKAEEGCKERIILSIAKLIDKEFLATYALSKGIFYQINFTDE